MQRVLQDELFDMVKPADPLRITLQDLIKRSGDNPSEGTLIYVVSALESIYPYHT